MRKIIFLGREHARQLPRLSGDTIKIVCPNCECLFETDETKSDSAWLDLNKILFHCPWCNRLIQIKIMEEEDHENL